MRNSWNTDVWFLFLFIRPVLAAVSTQGSSGIESQMHCFGAGNSRPLAPFLSTRAIFPFALEPSVVRSVFYYGSVFFGGAGLGELWHMVLEKAPATSPGDLGYCRKADHEHGHRSYSKGFARPIDAVMKQPAERRRANEGTCSAEVAVAVLLPEVELPFKWIWGWVGHFLLWIKGALGACVTEKLFPRSSEDVCNGTRANRNAHPLLEN
ncbi:hypothetical protein EK904_009075 [Melospiza melodia maxima]|nr:hypothetical protein EK904_009075 [Melospiza melodia maxima]